MLSLMLLACASDFKLIEPEEDPSVEIGETAPGIRVTPEAVDFGVVLEDHPVSQVIRVESTGDSDLILAGVELVVGAAYTVTLPGAVLLPPGEYTELTVTLQDPGDADLQDWIRIDSNAASDPLVEVPLTAAPPPELEEPPDPGVDEPPTEPQEDTAPPEDVCECPEGFRATPAGDACQRLVEEEPFMSGTPVDVCAITPYFAYGKFGALYPDGLNIRDKFWGLDDGSSRGRLNEIGVWACSSPGSTVAGSAPVGEWIGFAVCLEIDEPGDYLVGVGADNKVQLYSDGALIFEETSGATRAFNYWYMQSVSLTSGTHILEFLGMNDGSIACFGGEIAGPFAAGTLTDDASMEAADYAGSIAWSTADAIGSAFEIGTTAGWTCPDGTSFSVCDDKPECLGIETEACL